ncbi:MAG: hypothetical protein ACRDCJ_02530 [Metamycoplasmataceae bacterium]
MSKVLKLLSVASIATTPLLMVACSQNNPIVVSNIKINRMELEDNFVQNPDSTFTAQSFDDFIKDFNLNPENYFTSNTNTSNNATPFITADINSFAEIGDAKKPNIKVETTSSIPSFKTIKFTFELKNDYKPQVIIEDSPTVSQPALETKAFSMSFRILIPEKDTSERQEEIDWIHSFFNTNFFLYINTEIKAETEAKTAAQIVSEITNKTEFEKVFIRKVEFPYLISSWDYDVMATPDPDNAKAVIMKFSLSNPLFVGSNALTPEEESAQFILLGLAG